MHDGSHTPPAHGLDDIYTGQDPLQLHARRVNSRRFRLALELTGDLQSVGEAALYDSSRMFSPEAVQRQVHLATLKLDAAGRLPPSKPPSRPQSRGHWSGRPEHCYAPPGAALPFSSAHHVVICYSARCACMTSRVVGYHDGSSGVVSAHMSGYLRRACARSDDFSDANSSLSPVSGDCSDAKSGSVC